MLWQETNKEAGKCGFEKSVSKVLWTISNPDFRPPHGFCGIVADLAQGTGPATEGLMAQLLLVSAPGRLSHMLDSTHLQPKQALFTSQVGF